jgi:glucose-1-phosphate adenylyltransferase
MDWYQGTADAVRKQLPHLANARVEDILILAGDHLYRMDYEEFVTTHREKRADVTIAVQPVSRSEASRFGILKANEDGRVVSFYEKPSEGALDALASDPGSEKPFLASMGIYCFRKHALQASLDGTEAEDFGREVIPAAIEGMRVYAHQFDGYWADIGTIRAFYEANLALTFPDPPFDFYDPRDPMYTRPRFLPPSRVDGCCLDRTVLAQGCLLSRADVRESVVGLRSIVRDGARLVRSVMMGADIYETREAIAENRMRGRPDIGIGRGSSVEGAIIDKNARIGEGVTIRARAVSDEIVDTENYVVREGIVVIPKNATIPDGAVI